MQRLILFLAAYTALATIRTINAFSVVREARRLHPPRSSQRRRTPDAVTTSQSSRIASPLAMVQQDKGNRDDSEQEEILGPLADAAKIAANNNNKNEKKAATGTVNERLLTELQQAENKEKYGARSSMGQKMGVGSFYGDKKTDKERQAAIDEARDLNGVNPVVALMGSVVALAGAAALWSLTTFLAEYFTLHPVTSDVYFVARVQSVMRNVVMGLVTLAAGFFGVTGFGIFLLGVRVAYGVIKGELDPTPIQKTKVDVDEDVLDMPSAWDLMMNKKTKRGRR